MFGRVAVAAPPENGALFDEVVEPRLPDFPRGQVRARAVVLERAGEGERSSDVVVGHDQRPIEAIVNVIFDRSELADDSLICPVLERPAQVHADQLAEHGGISAVEIVGWQWSHEGFLKVRECHARESGYRIHTSAAFSRAPYPMALK